MPKAWVLRISFPVSGTDRLHPVGWDECRYLSVCSFDAGSIPCVASPSALCLLPFFMKTCVFTSGGLILYNRDFDRLEINNFILSYLEQQTCLQFIRRQDVFLVADSPTPLDLSALLDMYENTGEVHWMAQPKRTAPRPFVKKQKVLPSPKQDSLDYSNASDKSHSPISLPVAKTPLKNAKPKSLISFNLPSFSGPLDLEKLNPIIQKVREHLINKNVAPPAVDAICNNVSAALVGKQVSKFKSLDSLVWTEIRDQLSLILSPNSSIDLLKEIQNSSDPYSIAFVGVNGVGKSTNLSKICFWLLQNNLSVLIAACDTFRSGAIEQLGVHVRNLNSLEKTGRVELFDKGYGKDPAGIAKDALQYAKKNGHDVVLIDTAGRMQDNQPLMRSLAKLISINNPNKIVFVGEALVGNEAIHQLSKFNQSIQDFSDKAKPRSIDAMVLTKFDTVDDQVGAAVSMTFITGKPILFVGTGQTYTDLQKMNVDNVVDTLLAK